jgi:streptogramin lyase
MKGTDRTMRLLRAFALAVLLAAIFAATGATAAKPKVIRTASGASLPELTYGTSVAVAPDGVAWFGVEDSSGPLLVSVPEGVPVTDYLYGEKRERPISTTSDLRFDPEGNLWFVKQHGRGPSTIARRAVDGSLAEFTLPGGEPRGPLAIGPAGEAWFSAGDSAAPRIGFIAPMTGAVTEFAFTAKQDPISLVAGPDGAIWFREPEVGKIGRITASGERRTFPLPHGITAGQIVFGPEGSLWFTDFRPHGHRGEQSAWIGRMTMSGKVRQFRIPFARRVEHLTPSPLGAIWFSTGAHELSWISTSGKVGPHGCLQYSCRKPIVALAPAPDGSVWFAIAHVFESCGECGGGSQLLLNNMGAAIGQIGPGTLGSPVTPP